MIVLTLISFASIAFGLANFTTSGCLDAAGTEICIQNAVASTTATCIQVCGCNDPFSCDNEKAECLIGCECEAYKESLNCVLSSCWNKVCIAKCGQQIRPRVGNGSSPLQKRELLSNLLQSELSLASPMRYILQLPVNPLQSELLKESDFDLILSFFRSIVASINNCSLTR
jgi:hypothetical protein